MEVSEGLLVEVGWDGAIVGQVGGDVGLDWRLWFMEQGPEWRVTRGWEGWWGR